MLGLRRKTTLCKNGPTQGTTIESDTEITVISRDRKWTEPT